MYLGLLFLALGQFWFTFKLLAISSVIMIFYYFLKEEWWCNSYAFKQLTKMKGGK
jgi:type III secretory pathway component EscS